MHGSSTMAVTNRAAWAVNASGRASSSSGSFSLRAVATSASVDGEDGGAVGRSTPDSVFVCSTAGCDGCEPAGRTPKTRSTQSSGSSGKLGDPGVHYGSRAHYG